MASSTSYAPPNIFPEPSASPIDADPPENPGGHRLVFHFLPLIIGGIDEKISNAKSSSMFQVLRYHTCRPTHLVLLPCSKLTLTSLPKAMGRIPGLVLHLWIIVIIRESTPSSSNSLLAPLASNSQSTQQDSDGQTDSSGKKGEDKIPGPPLPPLPVDSVASNGQSTQQDDGQMDSSGKKGQSKIPDLPRRSLTQPMDLAEKIKGMYRLLDLISESGSNGCGNEPFLDSLLAASINLFLFVVDKVIIAQDSLKRFINTICPESYASLTKVDFKALDRFMIKPLGIYGSKVEIVRFLRSLDAVNEDMCVDFLFPFCFRQVVDPTFSARLLLAPTESGGSRPALLSGLYVLVAGQINATQERHYVIYWPEDSTWDDSAASSVCRNRVTFMRWVVAYNHIFLAFFMPVCRYLTKMCDQVVALVSPEHAASMVWGDEDSDTESMDVDTGDDDRLFTYEVAKRNEQEESAVSRPGFQVIVSSVKHKFKSNLIY
jgi:hypothetical protein